MLRRDFLSRLAVACAAAQLALPELGSADLLSLDGARTPRTGSTRTLTAAQRRMIADLAEGIIPPTDTPGARGAGVPEFLALLYSEWCLPEQQTRWIDGLAALGRDTQQAFGREFAELPAEDQLTMLQKWDDEAFAASPVSPSGAFFRWFKSLTLIGYYTSEAGQLEELRVRFGAGQDTAAGPIIKPPPFKT